MEQEAGNKGLVGLMKSVFSGFDESDKENRSLHVEQTVSGGSGSVHFRPDQDPSTADSTSSGTGYMKVHKMPLDRVAKYQLLQEMSQDPVLASGIDLHLTHALSVDKATGYSISIESTGDEGDAIAAELMADLGDMINDNVVNWARPMAIFGCNYIRPYTEQGVGIKMIECNYYTQARFINRYERGGQVAGFTSEFLKQKGGSLVRLAEPWTLVELKIPYWTPDINREPVYQGGTQYSLYDDEHLKSPVLAQDYGTSLIEFTLEPWLDLREALLSLRGSRRNASRIDRMIGVSTQDLDPARSAEYLNSVGTQLRKNQQLESEYVQKKGIIPTIWNSLIPILGGDKGNLTIDTQTIDPSIDGIADIDFHLNRLCGAMGLDPTLLGWSGDMAASLGDGNFFRTSIAAALRANWLRVAITKAVYQLIDIHLANKHGKVWPTSDRPYKVVFNSMNTAIAEEEADQRSSNADFAMVVTTLMDQIAQGPMNKSDAYKNYAFIDLLKMDKDKAKEIISEMATDLADDDSFMESAQLAGKTKEQVKEIMLEAISEMEQEQGNFNE